MGAGRNRARALTLLVAGALLAGCGVTPPHPRSPAPSSTSSSSVTNSSTPSSSATIPPVTPTQPTTSLPSAPATPPSTPPTTPPNPGEQLSNDQVDCHKAKCVALTFDDGPGPYTAELLSHLARAEAPATFFVLGENVKANPAVAKATAAAGHELGVHTWDHRRLIFLDAADVRKELTSTVKVIKQTTGVTPRLLRPPYGETNRVVATQARRAKLAQVLWDVDTLDWKTRSTKKTIKAAVKSAKRGSIVLLHDIHRTTVAAVPAIIKGLRKKGYTLVTVSQLLGKAKPGRIYSRS